MSDPLQLSLLGKPEIRKDGQLLTVDLLSAKGQALLIYLAVSGQSASRSALAGLLWGDMPEERAKANLRLTLTKVRPLLADYLIVDRQNVTFNFDQPHWLDVADFEAALGTNGDHGAGQSSGKKLLPALSLYRGDFLSDFQVPDAPDFEEWALVEQERLRHMAIQALVRVAEDARQRGDFKEGIQATRKLLLLEPAHEEAHQQLMWLLAYSGQRSAALLQFETCRRALHEELAVEPAAETVALYEQIKAGVNGQTSQLANSLPRLTEMVTPHHNLPAQRTPFIGREAEIAQITTLLNNPTCRLLTLVGSGGIGKTRLALAAAEAQLPHFQHGVNFVSLVGVTPAREDEASDLLINNIANALNYSFSAQRPPRELLLYHLAGKEMLLLLDNFEQLQAATEFLVELLHVAPAVKLLVTSRVRLGTENEWLFDVEGLPYPPATANAEGAADYPATRLFAQSAQRIQPSFVLSQEADAVNRICQLVNGLPLALELAANWVRILTCAEIVARLEREPVPQGAGGLDLLSTTTAIVAERHQNMRVILAHSWELLSEEEQACFRRISLFRGGFELAAAEQVAGATLPILAGLVDKSWLRRDEEGRYLIHELLRQYGAEQLATHPAEQSATQQQHTRYYADYLQAQRAPLAEGVGAFLLAKLDQEIENLRAAWERLVAQQEIEAIATFLEALWLYYELKGWFQEAAFVLDEACRLPGASAIQKARWHRWRGEAYYQMGQLEECRELLERAMAFVVRPLPTTQMGWLSVLFSQLLRQTMHRLIPFFFVARSPAKEDAFAEGARITGRLGQLYYFAEEKLPLLATALFDLNLSEQAGALDEMAHGYAVTSLTVSNIPLFRLAGFYGELARQNAPRVQSLPLKAHLFEVLGLAAMGQGRWIEAIEALETSAAIVARLGLRRWWEEARLLLALIAYHRGQFAQSTQGFRDALDSARQRNDALAQFWALLGQAENALRVGGINAGNVMFILEEAKNLPEKYWGRAELVRLHGVLALVYLHQGNHAQARQLAHKVARLIKQTSFWVFWSIEGYASPAEIFLTLWELGAAGKLTAAEKRELAKSGLEACKALHQFANIFIPGQPRAWLYQGLYHWLKNKPSKAFACWEKSLTIAKRLVMPYEEGRAHYEIGRHLSIDDPARQEHLSAARKIFTRLGVPVKEI